MHFSDFLELLLVDLIIVITEGVLKSINDTFMWTLLLNQLLPSLLQLKVQELNFLTQYRILLLQTRWRRLHLLLSLFDGLLKKLDLFGELFNFPGLLIIKFLWRLVVLLV